MSRPNVLFLYTDEQRSDTMAAYGNDKIDTPNLNRLAAQSTVFQRAYCTQPVCTPSRGSILTGLYPHTTGLVANNLSLRPETRCLPELLEDGDYFCAHHGKWHLGDEIFQQHGFDEWVATEDTYHAFYSPERDQADRSAFHDFLLEKGHEPEPNHLPQEIGYRFFRKQIARLPEDASRPSFLGQEASRFIKEQQSRPWVLYVNFLEPHMPFYGPRDEQYDPSEVELPSNWDHRPGEGFPLRTQLKVRTYAEKGFELDPRLSEADEWRKLVARYWGLCSQVDTYVGNILRTLEETGQADNTIIVYTSDHGDQMSSHGLLGKGQMFEESACVPLLVHLPGQSSMQKIASPVSQIDLVPTLLDLMDQPIPDELQGKSRRDVLEGKRDRIDDDVFFEWNGQTEGSLKEVPDYARDLGPEEAIKASHAQSLRNIATQDGLKLCVSTVGEHMFFDLNKDPEERHNAINDAQYKERIGELFDRIRGWQEETDDELALPNPAP